MFCLEVNAAELAKQGLTTYKHSLPPLFLLRTRRNEAKNFMLYHHASYMSSLTTHAPAKARINDKGRKMVPAVMLLSLSILSGRDFVKALLKLAQVAKVPLQADKAANSYVHQMSAQLLPSLVEYSSKLLPKCCSRRQCRNTSFRFRDPSETLRAAAREL